MKIHKKGMILLIAMLLALCFVFAGCGFRPRPISATNLMVGIKPQSVSGLSASNNFVQSTADFSLELFRQSFDGVENTLISPTSVLLALAMTANGAKGNTLLEMEEVLGGGISISQLNRYLYSFSNSLPSLDRSTLEISNSIWFRENGFEPNQKFLQTNANYFSADAFSAPFDNRTAEDINNWVFNATKGMIEQVLQEIPEDAVMYLINAIMFDADWARAYERGEVRNG